MHRLTADGLRWHLVPIGTGCPSHNLTGLPPLFSPDLQESLRLGDPMELGLDETWLYILDVILFAVKTFAAHAGLIP